MIIKKLTSLPPIILHTNPMKSLEVRFVTINSLLLSLFAVLIYGFQVFDQFLIDPYHIVPAIVVAHVIMIFVYYHHVRYMSKNFKRRDDILKLLKERKKQGDDWMDVAYILYQNMTSRHHWFKTANTMFVMVGLFGTLVGNSIAVGFISQLPVDAVSGGGNEMVRAVLESLGSFTGAVSTAFNTSIVGMVALMWHTLNLQLINGAIQKYMNDMEHHVLIGDDRQDRQILKG